MWDHLGFSVEISEAMELASASALGPLLKISKGIEVLEISVNAVATELVTPRVQTGHPRHPLGQDDLPSIPHVLSWRG